MERAKLIDRLKHAFALRAVGSAGSLRAAALELRTTQPSLSRAIQDLEDAVGHKLTERTRKGTRITRHGRALEHLTRRIDAEITQFERELGDGPTLPSVELRIGTYESIAIYFWPEFLRHLSRSQQSLSITLETGTSPEIESKLRRGQLDLAVIVEPQNKQGVLRCEEIFRDSYSFFVSSHLQPSEALSLPLIIVPHATDASGITMQEWMERNRLGRKAQYMTSSFEVARTFCQNGLGTAVLPLRVAAPRGQLGRLRQIQYSKRLRSVFGEHRIFFCARRDRFASPPVENVFRELIHFEDILR